MFHTESIVHSLSTGSLTTLKAVAVNVGAVRVIESNNLSHDRTLYSIRTSRKPIIDEVSDMKYYHTLDV